MKIFFFRTKAIEFFIKSKIIKQIKASMTSLKSSQSIQMVIGHNLYETTATTIKVKMRERENEKKRTHARTYFSTFKMHGI